MEKRITPKNLDEVFSQEVVEKLPSNRTIKNSIANKKHWENPTYRKKIEDSHNSEAYKNDQSKRSKSKWESEKFRSKREQSLNDWAKSDKRRQEVSRQMSGKAKSVTHRQSMSQSQKDFYKTAEGKKALEAKSAKQKGQKRPVVTCPYCGKQGADRIMGRWHFDNCKHKK